MSSLYPRDPSFGRDHQAGVLRGIIAVLFVLVPLMLLIFGPSRMASAVAVGQVVPWLAR